MTEQEWLASTDPQRMLTYLAGDYGKGYAEKSCRTDRKLRLFAVAWYRSIQPHRENHEALAQQIEERGEGALPGADTIDVQRLIDSCSNFAANHKNIAINGAMLLREVIGNPFRPIRVEPAWLSWNSGIVARLAVVIYSYRQWETMPILADALEDSGATDNEILTHCRSGGPHSRGCWVVDLLLGKS